MNTSPRRGDILRVCLDPVQGSEQGGERPVLVISPDLINEHSHVILVAAITSRKTERVFPYEVVLERGEGGLPKRLKVMLTHIRSLDKSRVLGLYGAVSEQIMQRVEYALKVATGLIRY